MTHSRLRLRRRPAQRGVTLLEGLMSSLILLLGLVGVLSGIIVASRQNSNANKMTRAGAIAGAVRAGLSTQGGVALNAAGGLFAGCGSGTGVAALGEYLDGLESIGDYELCVKDLDTFDAGAAANRTITPGYGANSEDRSLYRRVVVRYRDPSSGRVIGASVVVSWLELVGAPVRRAHRQYVAFYDASSLGGFEQ